MPYETLKKIKPRKYQEDIFENCKEKNCLVVLPTGIGKTLIALMLSIYTQKNSSCFENIILSTNSPFS